MFSKAVDKLKSTKDTLSNKVKKNDEEITLENATEEYSEESFWDKCKNYASSIGKTGLEKTFTLYYATEHKNCTLTHKTAIYGALGYLISPIDAIPDLTPVLGYTDDIGLIGATIVAVSGCIDEGVVEKAKEKVTSLFT